MENGVDAEVLDKDVLDKDVLDKDVLDKHMRGVFDEAQRRLKSFLNWIERTPWKALRKAMQDCIESEYSESIEVFHYVYIDAQGSAIKWDAPKDNGVLELRFDCDRSGRDVYSCVVRYKYADGVIIELDPKCKYGKLSVARKVAKALTQFVGVDDDDDNDDSDDDDGEDDTENVDEQSTES